MPRAPKAVCLLFGLTLIAACGSANTVTSGAAPKAAEVPVVDSTRAATAGLTADQIWSKAKSKALSANGFHVYGELAPERKGTTFVRFNFSMDNTRQLAFGSMQTGPGSVLIRRYADVLYFRGDRSFWHESSTTPKGKARAGHWFKVTRDGKNDYQKFFALTDTATILDRALAYVADEEGRLAVAPGNREYSTIPNIGLSGKAKGDTDTVFVSTTDASAPELLQVSLDSRHFFRFDTWNTPLPMKAGKQEAGAVSLDR